MKAWPGFALAPILAAPVTAQEAGDAWMIGCHFRGLPPVVRSGTYGVLEQRLRVGGRPAVVARDDGRAGGITRATLDGYTFGFFILFGDPDSPVPGVFVTRGWADVIPSTKGRCGTVAPADADAFLGPPDASPLRIDPVTGAP